MIEGVDMIPDVKIGDNLVCPVCNKEFRATADIKYIAKGGYTCSWKCFLARVREVETERKGKK